MVLGIAAVLAAWIMLSIMSGERQQRVKEFEANRPPAGPKPPLGASTLEKAPANPSHRGNAALPAAAAAKVRK